MDSPIDTAALAVRADLSPADARTNTGPSPAADRPRSRTRLVQDVLPWLTSLAVHAALVALGVATAAVVLRPPRPLSVEQVTPASGEFRMDASSVPDLAAGTGPADLAQVEAQDADAANAASGLSRDLGRAFDVATGGSGGPAAGPADLIAAGPGRFALGAIGGHGGGSGDGQGGPLQQFGMPRHGGGQGGSHLFVPARGASRVVFVCDATGTMIDKLGSLKLELTRAVDNLKPVQAFNVVFFTDGGKYVLADRGGLVLASPEHKRSAIRFLHDVVPTGTTDPAPALRAAFQQKPDVIHFLSDGEFNNLRPYEEVVAQVGKLNADGRVRVNTILFDTYDAGAEQVMRQIAKENGGTYRYVRQSDLN